MTKMIEVPEENLLALKEWREDRGQDTLIEVIDNLIAHLPKQIEVGSRVRFKGTDVMGTVLATDGDNLWIRRDDTGFPTTWKVKVEVVG